MAKLILPERYAQGFRAGPSAKPTGPLEIDWSHPSTRGLHNVYLPQGAVPDQNANGPSLRQYELLHKPAEYRALTAPDAIVTRQHVKHGAYHHFPQTQHSSNVIILGRDTDTGSDWNLGRGPVAWLAVARYEEGNSGDHYLLSTFAPGSNAVLNTSNTNIRDEQWHVVGGNYYFDGQKAIDFWEDGTFRASQNLADSNWKGFMARYDRSQTRWEIFVGVGEPIHAPYVGFRTGQTSTTWVGGIAAVFLWQGRNLSRAELQSLTRNPYQLFKPARPVLIPADGGAPGPITGSGSFAGSSTVDADGRVEKFGSGAFAGSATAQADGRIEAPAQPGSGSFAGASAFAADGVLVKRAAGTFAGTSAVSADGRRIKRGAGSFVGASAAQADGRVTSGTSGSFAGASAIQADGRVVRVYRDNANFAANSAFQGDGRIGGTQDGSGTFAGASAMSAAARQLYRSTGIFAGSSIWSGNGIIPSQTIGPIDKPGLVSGSPQPGLTSKSPKRGVIGSQGGL